MISARLLFRSGGAKQTGSTHAKALHPENRLFRVTTPLAKLQMQTEVRSRGPNTLNGALINYLHSATIAMLHLV